MSVKLIPIYPENLVTFEENWIFGCPKRLFWTPIASKRDIKFYTHYLILDHMSYY